MKHHLFQTMLCALTLAIATVSHPAASQSLSRSTHPTNTTMNTLTIRQQHLAAVAAAEATGDLDALNATITKALDAGVAVNDIKEAFSQLYAYTGFPRSLNALGCLQRLAAERAAASVSDTLGREASPLPTDFDALKAGTAIQTQLTGQPYRYDFAPATDYYLKAHLFGDIFASDVLNYMERELATVSALAALPAPVQLRSHLGVALNAGLSPQELEDFVKVLDKTVGDAPASLAREKLSDVLKERGLM